MATAPPRDERKATADLADVEVAELKALSDDLQRALAEERAMARTLLDTIKRLDDRGEELRLEAKA